MNQRERPTSWQIVRGAWAFLLVLSTAGAGLGWGVGGVAAAEVTGQEISSWTYIIGGLMAFLFFNVTFVLLVWLFLPKRKDFDDAR